VKVTVRYFAGARAAAGVEEETIDLEGSSPRPVPPTLATLSAVLSERHGSALTRVLAACSFLLDEVAGSRERPLYDGARVDVLPPFAGG